MTFTGHYEYPEWFNEKIYNFYEKKLEQLIKLKYINQEASVYYSKLHLKIYAPSIVITGISGVASFLSSSSMFSDNVQMGMAIGVGVLASVSTMIQSFASAVDYNTKSKAHGEAGEEYEKLITKLEFEMEMPNEPDFLDNLETQILDIQNKCKYPVPKHIVEQYLKKQSTILKKVKSTSNLTATNDIIIRMNDTHSQDITV